MKVSNATWRLTGLLFFGVGFWLGCSGFCSAWSGSGWIVLQEILGVFLMWVGVEILERT